MTIATAAVIAVLRLSPQVGFEPLEVRVETRVPGGGEVCVEVSDSTDLNEPVAHRSCWTQNDLFRPFEGQRRYILGAGSWDVRVVRTRRVLGRATVIVTEHARCIDPVTMRRVC